MSINATQPTDDQSPRFQQLLQLATDGHESAISDLWHEFAFQFESQQR